MFCRARTPNFFQVRANMMIKKKSVKTFCCYDQNQQLLIFSLLLFFVGICCRNKKMLPKCCPRMKKYFLLRKFFSKSLSNVSSDPGHRWSILGGRHKKKIPMYFFQKKMQHLTYTKKKSTNLNTDQTCSFEKKTSKVGNTSTSKKGIG